MEPCGWITKVVNGEKTIFINAQRKNITTLRAQTKPFIGNVRIAINRRFCVIVNNRPKIKRMGRWNEKNRYAVKNQVIG